MKFPLSWLARHLKTSTPVEDLAEGLTRLGLEVESIDRPAIHLQDFVVAQIESVSPHPNAERLHVCQIHDGKELHQVVCGASNVRVGLKCVFAHPGVVIPISQEKLRVSTIRGVESYGMLCSDRELGLSNEHEGITELNPEAQPGTSVATFYDDPVLDLSVTPNRADCFGVRGVARDLAAAGFGELLPLPAVALQQSGNVSHKMTYGDVEAQRYCPLFCAVQITGVTNRPSPPWLQELLKKAGQNPISALVDVTNFFSLDRCRPLHCYDVRAFSGSLVVRSAAQGESFTDLKGRVHTLSPFMSVLADPKGALGLLGVMGGERSASLPDTSTVMLEAAWFEPEAIARTGQALNLTTEARMRFERGVDDASTLEDLKAAAAMIVELCGGTVSTVFQLGLPPERHTAIALPPNLLEERAGVSIPPEETTRLLTAIGCVETAPRKFLPPTWRHDLTRPENLCGEILRFYGFDRVETRPLPVKARGADEEAAVFEDSGMFKRQLAGRGMVELVSYVFVRPAWAELFQTPETQHIALLNPISSEFSVLRTSLFPNLLEAVMKNRRREVAPYAFFERGAVFDRRFEQYERSVLSGMRSGTLAAHHWSQRARPVDLFDIKADVLALLEGETFVLRQEAPPWMHPGCSGTFFRDATPVAVFGALHPEVLRAFDLEEVPVFGYEIFLDALSEKGQERGPPPILSALQRVTRDFAFIVEKTLPAETLLSCLWQAGKSAVAKVEVFDLYTGPPLEADKKSIGVSVTFQPEKATFSEEDLQKLSERIVRTVAARVKGVLR
ncbi:MAG: phenylalanine--tRNA ligase subunit beta [Holosporales bacterium]|jgi:phenylalanyl-tRNA synthetase beta chain|nr:phenylalanine--tRNA ligase subunit beta [Holosporales bacterium]